jgi:single-stranded-DNA-specific exonuclease
VTNQRPVGPGHLRLTLQRGERSFEAIRFHAADPVPPRIRAVYRPEVNEYQGYRSLQLLIEHCLPA